MKVTLPLCSFTSKSILFNDLVSNDESKKDFRVVLSLADVLFWNNSSANNWINAFLLNRLLLYKWSTRILQLNLRYCKRYEQDSLLRAPLPMHLFNNVNTTFILIVKFNSFWGLLFVIFQIDGLVESAKNTYQNSTFLFQLFMQMQWSEITIHREFFSFV